MPLEERKKKFERVIYAADLSLLVQCKQRAQGRQPASLTIMHRRRTSTVPKRGLGVEKVHAGGKNITQEMARLLRCTALYFLRQVFAILEVLRDFHRLFGPRNSPTTGILRTIRHVYRSMWPAREDKTRFGAALV